MTMPSEKQRNDKRVFVAVMDYETLVPLIANRDGIMDIQPAGYGLNNPMIEALQRMGASGQYDEIILAHGSSDRQTVIADAVFSRSHKPTDWDESGQDIVGSFPVLLTHAAQTLATFRLNSGNCRFSVLNELLEDVYLKNPSGHTFDTILSAATTPHPMAHNAQAPINGYAKDYKVSECCDASFTYDSSNITGIYLAMQAVKAGRSDSQCIHFCVFGPDNEKLAPARAYFTSDGGAQLIPAGSSLGFSTMDLSTYLSAGNRSVAECSPLSLAPDVIVGTGPANGNYRETIRNVLGPQIPHIKEKNQFYPVDMSTRVSAKEWQAQQQRDIAALSAADEGTVSPVNITGYQAPVSRPGHHHTNMVAIGTVVIPRRKPPTYEVGSNPPLSPVEKGSKLGFFARHFSGWFRGKQNETAAVTESRKTI